LKISAESLLVEAEVVEARLLRAVQRRQRQKIFSNIKKWKDMRKQSRDLESGNIAFIETDEDLEGQRDNLKKK
jgi:hypothetical protein